MNSALLPVPGFPFRIRHIDQKTPNLTRGKIAVWRYSGNGWRNLICHKIIIRYSSYYFFHRLCHFLFHGVIQTLCLQLAERIARRFEVIRQLLGETLVEGGVLHVDDDALDFFVGDQLGKFIGFFLRRHRADRDVACSIGQHDQQRLDIGMVSLLLA